MDCYTYPGGPQVRGQTWGQTEGQTWGQTKNQNFGPNWAVCLTGSLTLGLTLGLTPNHTYRGDSQKLALMAKKLSPGRPSEPNMSPSDTREPSVSSRSRSCCQTR